jgi:hypothetical protein
MAVFMYGLVLIVFGIYSFWLIDPNITFLQNSYWVQFRDWAVYMGYYRRDISFAVFLALLILLFIYNLWFVKKYKQYSAIKIAAMVVFLGCISYPFISHDLFNYLFDARILTHYGLNPYTHTALDFQKDLWTRFMHWTHRTYPYGPTFLPLTLIPSYLGWGKFTLTFFLYKVMNSILYFLVVFLLDKKNKKEAILFATHPLIIIEGLINAHNDIIGVSLGLIGIYLLDKKYNLWGRVFFLLSAGIKYVTAPIVFIRSSLPVLRSVKFLFAVQILLILYLCFKLEIQPWYFLSLFVFLPYFLWLIERLNIFFFGLLLSYYPFIRFGDWTAQSIALKRNIVFVFALIQLSYLLFILLKKRSVGQVEVSRT